MAKSKPQPVEVGFKQKLKEWALKHRVLRVVIPLILLLFLYSATSEVVYRVQVHYEKQQFLQAQADLHSIYEEIVAKVGEPNEHRDQQSCDTVSISAEGREGLVCNLSQELYYVSADGPRSDVLLERVTGAVGASKLVESFHRGEIKASNAVPSASFSIRDFKTCSVSPSRVNPQELSIYISCSKPATSTYYDTIYR